MSRYANSRPGSTTVISRQPPHRFGFGTPAVQLAPWTTEEPDRFARDSFCPRASADPARMAARRTPLTVVEAYSKEERDDLSACAEESTSATRA